MDLAVPLTHPTPADLGCCDAKFSNDYGRCNRLYEVGKLLFILRGDGLALLLLCKLAELTCYWGLYPPANNWSFSVTTSAKGGVDIKIGSDTIHAPRHLRKNFAARVHHPLFRMVMLADIIFENTFFCMKSMVPKSIVDMTKKSRSSASGNVYGAGWIPAKPKSESFNSFRIIGRNNEPSIPVFFSDISTKEETSTTVSATPGPGVSGYHIATIEANKGSRVSNQIISKLSCEHSGGSGSEGIQRQQLLQQGTLSGGNHGTRLLVSTAQKVAFLANTNIKKIHTSMGSVDCGKGASRSVLDAAASIHEQLILNSPGDEGSNSPRSNVSPGITSSAETTCIPMPQVLNGNESEHTSGNSRSELISLWPIRSRVKHITKACMDAISCVVKISVATAAKARIDMNIGSHAIHVPKYFSEPDSSGAERGIKAVGAKTSATWVVAVAAPHHATGNSDLLSGFIAERDDVFVHGVYEVPMQVGACGAVVTDAVVLPDVWVVPGLTANLVSVSQLAQLGYNVGFGGGACYIRSAADGMIVGKAHLGEGGLYVLDFLRVPLAM